MPRMARVKTSDSIFHVMCRSISEVPLFKNSDDKLKYISYIKKFQKTYEFKVYGYCLMNNHVHLLIDINGSDISKVMHSINLSYALYFNKKHGRHGHLFQDRFKSKIITNDSYLFAVSAYIHNNATDIEGYETCPEQYEFSSLSVYLGIKQDPYDLISTRFVLGLFGKDPKAARDRYMVFVLGYQRDDLNLDIEFENEGTEYRSNRRIIPRNHKPEEILDYVIKKTKVSRIKFHMKNSRDSAEAKALYVVLARSFCNHKCKDICHTLGNITQSRVSALCTYAIELIDSNKEYRSYVEEFVDICIS